MLNKRIIPVLFMKQGRLIRSTNFRHHHPVGDPAVQAGRYNDWDVDELIAIDITPGGDPAALDVLDRIARVSFMPLSFGGGVRTLEDIRARLRGGADKVIINSQALQAPSFITLAAREFGSQAVVVAIDARRGPSGRPDVFGDHGRVSAGLDPCAWVKRLEELGAGEIFLQAADRDGMVGGYDLPLVQAVTEATRLPVVAAGGAGKAEDIAAVLRHASAAAVGNWFLFKELSYHLCKDAVKEEPLSIRRSQF